MATDNYSLIPSLRAPSWPSRPPVEGLFSPTNSDGESMTEANSAPVEPSSATPDYRYEVRLQLPIVSKPRYKLIPERLEVTGESTFRVEERMSVEFGSRDAVGVTTNLLSMNALLHYALGEWGRSHLATRILEAVMTEIFILWIHEQGHTNGRYPESRGIFVSEHNSFFSSNEIDCEQIYCGEYFFPFGYPFGVISGLEATTVIARNLLAFDMMRNGATPASVWAYSLASLDNLYQSRGYWRSAVSDGNDIGGYKKFLEHWHSDEESFDNEYDRRLSVGLLYQMIDPLFLTSLIRSVQGLVSDTGRIDDLMLETPFGEQIGFIPSTTLGLSPLGSFEYTLSLWLRIKTSRDPIGGRLYLRINDASNDQVSMQRENRLGELITEDGGGEVRGSLPWGLGLQFEHIPIGRLPVYTKVGFHYWNQPELMLPSGTTNDGIVQQVIAYKESGHFAVEGGLGVQLTDLFALELGGLWKAWGWLPGYPVSDCGRGEINLVYTPK